jgi:signal transduction histidine kinase
LLESERMSRMVHDLLTLARADAGYHLEREPLELSPILQDVARQIRPLSGQRSVEVVAHDQGIVKGNADALKQLVLIFVDNAVKHTRPDGRIRLELSHRDGSVVLSVADDGPGIPSTEIDRIFERFYRADPSRSGEGAGLGLAIAKWIVREHEGSVSAGNRPEGGAVFTVRLPEFKSTEEAGRADAA